MKKEEFEYAEKIKNIMRICDSIKFSVLRDMDFGYDIVRLINSDKDIKNLFFVWLENIHNTAEKKFNEI